MKPEESQESQELEKIIDAFQKEDNKDGYLAAKQKSKKKLNMLVRFRWLDILLQLLTRIVVVIFFGLLLYIQNATIFEIVRSAIEKDILDKVQPVLSIVTVSTIAETYGIAHIIVKWVVKDIKYDD